MAKLDTNGVCRTAKGRFAKGCSGGRRAASPGNTHGWSAPSSLPGYEGERMLHLRGLPGDFYATPVRGEPNAFRVRYERAGELTAALDTVFGLDGAARIAQVHADYLLGRGMFGRKATRAAPTAADQARLLAAEAKLQLAESKRDDYAFSHGFRIGEVHPSQWPEDARYRQLQREADQARAELEKAWSPWYGTTAGRAVTPAGRHVGQAARLTSAVPGLAGWTVGGGGPFAAPGKHSYVVTVHLPGVPGVAGPVKYSVFPAIWPNGRHRGYGLSVYPALDSRGAYADVGADGQEVSPYATKPHVYRSPQAAVAAVRKHAARHGVVRMGA